MSIPRLFLWLSVNLRHLSYVAPQNGACILALRFRVAYGIVSYSVRSIGDEWAVKRSSLVLEVPSAVIPVEKNFVINPLHVAFLKLVKGKPIPLPIDDRLRNWKNVSGIHK